MVGFVPPPWGCIYKQFFTAVWDTTNISAVVVGTEIRMNSFIARANGGEDTIENLRPICQPCNSSMGTRNMNEFIQTHAFHVRRTLRA